MNCTGSNQSTKKICDRREECRYYIGNYHEEIAYKMKQKHSVIFPSSCINNDYNMYEELEDGEGI